MKYLLFALALAVPLNAVACGPPKFGAFTTAPQDGRIVLEVRFHTPQEVRDICARLSQWPESHGAPACVGDRFTPGTNFLHVARPKDWDDADILLQIGHEVLHATKAEHR